MAMSSASHKARIVAKTILSQNDTEVGLVHAFDVVQGLTKYAAHGGA